MFKLQTLFQALKAGKGKREEAVFRKLDYLELRYWGLRSIQPYLSSKFVFKKKIRYQKNNQSCCQVRLEEMDPVELDHCPCTLEGILETCIWRLALLGIHPTRQPLSSSYSTLQRPLPHCIQRLFSGAQAHWSMPTKPGRGATAITRRAKLAGDHAHAFSQSSWIDGIILMQVLS